MRISQVLILATASIVFTCEALSATSYLDTQVISSDNPTQRLLRSVNDENVDEERKLDTAKMGRMRNNGMTARGYAEKLNIAGKLDEVMSAGAMAKFMGTHKYKKYVKYFNYLKDKKRGYR